MRIVNCYLFRKDRWKWTSGIFVIITVVCIIVIVKVSTNTTNSVSSLRQQQPTSTLNNNNTNILNNTTSPFDNANISNNNNNDNENIRIPIIPSNVHLVYFGNSMLLMNDCPGVIKSMIEQVSKNTSLLSSSSSSVTETRSSSSSSSLSLTNVISETCLRKGATLTSLFEKHKCNVVRDYVTITHNTIIDNSTSSNSTRTQQQQQEIEQTIFTFKKDNSIYHNWDYIIMNDQSQNPARNDTRYMSIETIKRLYGPLAIMNKPGKLLPIPILIQTPAYRIRGVMDTTDLGTFDNFTNSIAYGIIQYKYAFDEILLSSSSSNQQQLLSTSSYVEESSVSTISQSNSMIDGGARIAEVGIAYQYIRNTDNTLYKKLYQKGDFHPSKYGTWLQSCIIFITMFHIKPPDYDKDWLPSTYLSSSSSTLPSTRSSTKTKNGNSNNNDSNNNNSNNNSNGNNDNKKSNNGNNNSNNGNGNGNNNNNNNDNSNNEIVVEDDNDKLPTKAEAAKLLQVACDITRYC
jgi:hypothetical protein